MAILSLLAPILLELLKLFFGGSSAADKQKVADKILQDIRAINAAVQKAQDSEGDTSDLEDIINRKP